MSDNSNANGTESSSSEVPPASLQTRLIEHVQANKVDAALWATRMLTILFTLAYILPVFGSAQSAYNKVLLANAATSALRLHQRLPTLTLSREFLVRLVVEDSCHYFLFTVIFYFVSPMLMVIVPVALFALLHASSYSLKLLDIIGQNSWWGARFLISLVEFQTNNILRCVAFSEIFLMPIAIFMVFMGRAGLMTPFIYYHFLGMRYLSRRNPYSRKMFSELRMTIEQLANRSPAVVSKILRAGIAIVTRLAPQQHAAPAQ